MDKQPQTKFFTKDDKSLETQFIHATESLAGMPQVRQKQPKT